MQFTKRPSASATRLVRIIRLAGPALLMLWFLSVHGVQAEASADAGPGPKMPAPNVVEQPTVARPGGPQKVKVGFYLQNIPEIDVKTNSYAAEFYLWFVWNGDLDPTHSFELTNVVNVGELTKIPIFTDDAGNPAPETLPDGSKLQQFHIYGRFGRPFPLTLYPFDDHDVFIAIEDARHSNSVMVYELDEPGTAMRKDLVIPGWKLSPMKAALSVSRFETAFGDTRTGRVDESYSHAEFTVHIERPLVGIISKTLIPIALIILITFGAFFLQPADIDARLCLTITALISAVALQGTAATELPPTGSLLLLDKVYILSYLAILAVTFCSIGSNRFFHAEKPASAAKVDRVGLWATALGYFGVMAFFVVRAQ